MIYDGFCGQDSNYFACFQEESWCHLESIWPIYVCLYLVYSTISDGAAQACM